MDVITKVPFLDLNAQYRAIKPEVDAAIQAVLDASAFAGGRFVSEFEEKFAAYCHCDYAIGVGNGTVALWLAMLALDIGPDDEVITAANTFIATAEAISFTGARPVFVDVDESSYNIDPAQIEAAITPKTRAIIPVHLFGQMADMDPIMEIAKKHDLYVIEDASQAHGAEYKGRRAGSIGDVACFSFYPGKNLGAYGEAGGIVTGNAALADKIRMLRDHGQSKKYHHEVVGWNGRMDGIQGAVLSVKLDHIEKWTEQRRDNAAAYREYLSGKENMILPPESEDGRHVYHIYAVRLKNRDNVLAQLAEQNIFCGIHYPVPLHLQNAYKWLDYKMGDFPVAERCAAEYLSLPMFPELSREQIEKTTAALIETTGAVPQETETNKKDGVQVA